MWLRQNEDSVTMITKIHMASVGVSKDWSLDSSAAIHVCNDKLIFKVCKELKEFEEVLTSNHGATKVLDNWNVGLNLISGEKLTDINAFYI